MFLLIELQSSLKEQKQENWMYPSAETSAGEVYYLTLFGRTGSFHSHQITLTGLLQMDWFVLKNLFQEFGVRRKQLTAKPGQDKSKRSGKQLSVQKELPALPIQDFLLPSYKSRQTETGLGLSKYCPAARQWLSFVSPEDYWFELNIIVSPSSCSFLCPR